MRGKYPLIGLIPLEVRDALIDVKELTYIANSGLATVDI